MKTRYIFRLKKMGIVSSELSFSGLGIESCSLGFYFLVYSPSNEHKDRIYYANSASSYGVLILDCKS